MREKIRMVGAPVAAMRDKAVKGRGLLLFGLVLPLAACSSIPKEMNPMSWFGSDNKPTRTASAAPVTAAAQPVDSSQPFPNLSSVPEPPRPTMDPGQRLAAVRDLEKDRQSARQQDAALRQAMPPAPSAPMMAPPTAGLVTPVPMPAAPAATPMAPAATPAAPAAAPMGPAVRPMGPVAMPPPLPAPSMTAPASPSYPAEPPPARTASMPQPSAAPPAAAGVLTQPGARYAIPPRPPISPPEPLSTQPGALRS